MKDAGIDATIPVYFPKNGVYSARATADNAGEYFIGGKKIIMKYQLAKNRQRLLPHRSRYASRSFKGS